MAWLKTRLGCAKKNADPMFGTTFLLAIKKGMKPQQQNTDLNGQSHVYVQKPDGEVVNVQEFDRSSAEGKTEEGNRQTAPNTPTTHSKEVTDGEDA